MNRFTKIRSKDNNFLLTFFLVEVNCSRLDQISNLFLKHSELQNVRETTQINTRQSKENEYLLADAYFGLTSLEAGAFRHP